MSSKKASLTRRDFEIEKFVIKCAVVFIFSSVRLSSLTISGTGSRKHSTVSTRLMATRGFFGLRPPSRRREHVTIRARHQKGDAWNARELGHLYCAASPVIRHLQKLSLEIEMLNQGSILKRSKSRKYFLTSCHRLDELTSV